jgi:hypothetical protein
MRNLDLSTIDHPVFVFLNPTEERINGSVAWVAECKTCHKQQLVGSSQIKRGTHNRCIFCQLENNLDRRSVAP